MSASGACRLKLLFSGRAQTDFCNGEGMVAGLEYALLIELSGRYESLLFNYFRNNTEEPSSDDDIRIMLSKFSA